MPLLQWCFGRDYHYTSCSPIESTTALHIHTHPRAHRPCLSPPLFSCLKIDLFLNDLLKAAGCKTGMFIGLTIAHPLKSSPCLYTPTPHLQAHIHIHAQILRAAHSGCRWQPLCVRQGTLCVELVNRESSSLTCRQRFSSSPGEQASLWSEWGDSSQVMTICSLHPDFLSPPCALGEDTIRATINMPQSSVTELVTEPEMFDKESLFGCISSFFLQSSCQVIIQVSVSWN